MEQKIVHLLLVASGGLFATAIGLAAFAPRDANFLVMVTGLGSAALLMMALGLFAVFKMTAAKRAG